MRICTVCTHACRVCVREHPCTRSRTCLYACGVRVLAYPCMRTCACVHACDVRVDAYPCISTCVCVLACGMRITCARLHIRACAHSMCVCVRRACRRVCMRAYACVCGYVCYVRVGAHPCMRTCVCEYACGVRVRYIRICAPVYVYMCMRVVCV